MLVFFLIWEPSKTKSYSGELCNPGAESFFGSLGDYIPYYQPGDSPGMLFELISTFGYIIYKFVYSYILPNSYIMSLSLLSIVLF